MWRLVFFISVLFISCYSLERDCKPFQQGEFKFTQIINGEIKSSYFTRDSIFEVELFEGKIDTSSIRWVNDCECILTKLSPNNNQEKRPIQIRIISTKDDRYTFEYSLVGDSKNRQRGSIQKIN
ncbi:DNA topoisomerase IV [Flavobacteriaceae bacterium]|nr:DNA topoisomerase IV [Flavobacteriaceae bacterium]